MTETVVFKMNSAENTPGDFERIYDANYPVLYRIVYRITGDQAISEDLCQEAFIRYYRRNSPLPSDEQAKYWLIRVVRNLALNHEKRKIRERKAYERFRKEPSPSIRSGEAEIMRHESAELVQAALGKLPFKLRSAIVLREFGSLRYREIARILNISEANVKVRIFRAREMLKRYLDEEETRVF